MTEPTETVSPLSIRSILAVLPSEKYGAPLSWESVGKYLQKHYDTQEERDRNGRHCLRAELYRDGGVEFMKKVIDAVITDHDVRELRKKWVEHTRFNNPLKRVVNELATVYASPAKRTVSGDDNNKKYQTVLDAVSMDEQMLQLGRMLALHRALLVRFRVRTLPGDSEETPNREPAIDIATPATVRALLHPNDPTMVVGWLVRTSYRTHAAELNVPCWTLWTDYERIQLREDMQPIVESYLEHGLGRSPWVAVSLTPPGAGFWPGDEGEDLVAAAVSSWFVRVLMLKEAKSATKMPIISGDGSYMARGQAADTDIPVELADGQSVTTVDMSMDLSLFRDTDDHIIEHVAQNYGMSAALINQAGVQSADARELMRVPLRELRIQQQVPLRKMERRLALVMVAVLAKDLPEMLFSADGWLVEFGEAQTPLSRKDMLDIFLASRTANLDNTIDMIIALHPGMTEDQAQIALDRNIAIETARNIQMRPLMASSGAAMGGDPNKQPVDPAMQLENQVGQRDVMAVLKPSA
jgi:hypothetical protein